MNDDNETEDDGLSRSVFGDDPDTGASSVFGDSPDSSSVFGDATGSSSVFGDDEPELPLGDEPAEFDTVSIGDSGSGSSVFGDADSGSSVFGDDSAEMALPDAEMELPEVEAPSSLSLDDYSTPDGDLDVTTATPVLGLGDDELPESDSVFAAHSEPDPVFASDDMPTGEAISLDVEPGDEDDLDAWSDLSASAPAWGEGSDVAPEPEAWDPGPAPETAEPATVAIGEDSGERFFTYDDHGADEFGAGDFGEEIGSGSDMQSRIITGVLLLGIAVVALTIGPLLALALIVVIVALSAGEFYNALRVAGYQPATLLGLTASIAMPLAVYFRGTQAVALVMALAVVFGLLWFLAGVSSEMPVMNLGVTLLGVIYIGVLGSFGAAMLEIAQRGGINGDDGTGLLLAAIIVTVGYDVGAFFAGRSFGRTPLAAVSPNKTVEGLIGGSFASFIAAIVFLSVLDFIQPFAAAQASLLQVAILGVVGAIIAPLGDLSESLIKRDLGIKDMGSILPGHGGFLDRFDALLFVLPAVYFFAEAVFYTA